MASVRLSIRVAIINPKCFCGRIIIRDLSCVFGPVFTELDPDNDPGEPDGAEGNAPRNQVLEAILSKRTKKH